MWVLPGCIVMEIRDGLQSANNQLVCVQFAMDEANKGLAQANQSLATANDLLGRTNARLDAVEQGLTRLDRTNTLIDNVEQGLGRIDNTNTNLTDLQRQLAMLESIEKSLMRLDQHLAGLRKTVGALDGVIPFLDLGGAYEEPSVAAPGEVSIAAIDEANQPDADPAAPPSTPTDAAVASSDKPAAEGAPAPAVRRDSFMGVWMSAYPDRSIALVAHSTGRYERAVQKPAAAPAASPAAAPRKPSTTGADAPASTQDIEYGTWKRTGELVEFTPDAPAPAPEPAASAVPGATQPAGAPPGQPVAAPPWRIKIVSISPRAMAVEMDGKLVLFSRP